MRGDRLLLVDNGADMFWTIFKVAADGTTLQAVTPALERVGYGGVLQVLTTEESSHPTSG